ncbi:MAG: RIP metalloprotease RseP [Pyrinomonadaceae bacterium]|nr:RIP metalloprotease RseP [Pyrinomonadaceae bacterium]MCX7639129.1 RIP metalloprotease RseP [Pyrinomonadaceae bacterium]MDW8303650.1 RIP metalloprotease RseP [Acidobacteriota bacterium]
MEVIIAILAVIFVLGVAINIHEFGHFIMAKIFGMRVEAYSFFGLGPRVWGFKIGHTDYRISAIPLGAYVKLYGDEVTAPLEGGASQKEHVPEKELYELRPRWQKFLVIIGGPLMNILLALAIPFFIALFYGVPSNPAPIVGFVKPGGEAEKAGLRVGDRIIKFDGVENPTWRRIERDALLAPGKAIPVVVEREGQIVELTIKPLAITEAGQTAGILDFEPDFGSEPVVVGRIEPTMPAAESGLQVGDWIVSVNGKVVRNRQEMKKIINELKDRPIKLQVNRNGERLEIETRAVERNGDWLIGIAFNNTLSGARESVGVLGAMAFAWETNVEILRMTAKAFGQVSTGERSARDTVSGPIGIVQIIVQMVFAAGFLGLLSLLGIISLNLGVINLLPIPLLDGGQIMMLGIEKVYDIFGKTMPMVVKERIQMVGLAIILLLILLTTFNDISRFFR